MIRELICDWFRPNWRPPLTAPAEDPLLELAAWEQQIRADERRRVVRQENTAHGQPPRRIDRHVDEVAEELTIEAAERGIDGDARTRWVERQLDDPTSEPTRRIGTYLELHRKETPA